MHLPFFSKKLCLRRLLNVPDRAACRTALEKRLENDVKQLGICLGKSVSDSALLLHQVLAFIRRTTVNEVVFVSRPCFQRLLQALFSSFFSSEEEVHQRSKPQLHKRQETVGSWVSAPVPGARVYPRGRAHQRSSKVCPALKTAMRFGAVSGSFCSWVNFVVLRVRLFENLVNLRHKLVSGWSSCQIPVALALLASSNIYLRNHVVLNMQNCFSQTRLWVSRFWHRPQAGKRRRWRFMDWLSSLEISSPSQHEALHSTTGGCCDIGKWW